MSFIYLFIYKSTYNISVDQFIYLSIYRLTIYQHMYIYIGLTTGGGPILGEHGDKIQNKKVCQADF